MTTRDRRPTGQHRELTGALDLIAYGIAYDAGADEYTIIPGGNAAAWELQSPDDYLLVRPMTGATKARMRQRNGADILIYTVA